MNSDDDIIEKIRGKYGDVIDLRASPGVIIDILRQFGPDAIGDGGAPPGGAPTGPTSAQGAEPTIRDVMKELTKVSREVAKLRKQIGT